MWNLNIFYITSFSKLAISIHITQHEHMHKFTLYYIRIFMMHTFLSVQLFYKWPRRYALMSFYFHIVHMRARYSSLNDIFHCVVGLPSECWNDYVYLNYLQLYYFFICIIFIWNIEFFLSKGGFSWHPDTVPKAEYRMNCSNIYDSAARKTSFNPHNGKYLLLYLYLRYTLWDAEGIRLQSKCKKKYYWVSKMTLFPYIIINTIANVILVQAK